MINLIGAYIFGIIALGLWRNPLPIGEWNRELEDSPMYFLRSIVLGISAVLLLNATKLVAVNEIPVLGWLVYLFWIVNLWIHEAGHGFLMFGGRTLAIAGGTIFELGVPLTVIAYALHRRYLQLVPFLWFWLGHCLTSVGTYMADARARKLELFGAYDKSAHDWGNMFGDLGLLQHDTTIGGVTWWIGVVVMLLGIAGGVSRAYRAGVRFHDGGGH